jgi:hypothetical protein
LNFAKDVDIGFGCDDHTNRQPAVRSVGFVEPPDREKFILLTHHKLTVEAPSPGLPRFFRICIS